MNNENLVFECEKLIKEELTKIDAISLV